MLIEHLKKIFADRCRKNPQYSLRSFARSLERNPVESRDVAGTTMAISSKKLPEARRLIQDFRRNLSAFLEAGPKDSVYRLNVQIFPVLRCSLELGDRSRFRRERGAWKYKYILLLRDLRSKKPRCF